MIVKSMKVTVKITLLLMAFVGGQIVSAHSGDGHTYTGGYRSSDAADLKFVISGGDSNYQTLMKNAALSWNGISSKVKLSNSSTGAKMSIIKSTKDPSDPTLVGKMFPYYYYFGNLIPASNSDVWDLVDAKGYSEAMFGYQSFEIQSVYTHEIGHALSLGHNQTKPTIMYNPFYRTTYPTSPTTADKDHLKLKWGY